jgi:hypothetical protein
VHRSYRLQRPSILWVVCQALNMNPTPLTLNPKSETLHPKRKALSARRLTLHVSKDDAARSWELFAGIPGWVNMRIGHMDTIIAAGHPIGGYTNARHPIGGYTDTSRANPKPLNPKPLNPKP